MPQSDKVRIEGKIRRAVGRLLQQDRLLLELDVNERSITHKLAMYIQTEFRRWNVDCEYNKRGHDPKTLKNLQHCRSARNADITEDDETEGSRVYPDIIVHHRTKKKNLLVIEVKKSSSHYSNKCDEEKLREFRRQPGYRYDFGVFLKIKTRTTDISPDNVVKKLRFVGRT